MKTSRRERLRGRRGVAMSKFKFIAVFFMSIALACGKGDLLLPEACRSYPSITVYTGETASLTPCFISTGSELSYSVISSDPTVADAVLRILDVIITAKSPGETEITITATNADGSADAVVSVTVPNREPEVVGTLEAIRMVGGTTVKREISGLFQDPDMQELTYTTETSHAGIVNATVSNEILSIKGLAEGSTDVLITASDGQASATAILQVSVIRVRVIYEESFDGGIGRWYKDHKDMELRTRAGNLETWGTSEYHPIGNPIPTGIALLGLDVSLFDIEARLRPGKYETASVLGIGPAHPEYFRVEINIWKTVYDYEYTVFVLKRDEGWDRWAEGFFELTDDEFVDVRARYDQGQYHIKFNDNELISVGDESMTTGDIDLVAFIAEHWCENRCAQNPEDMRIFMDEITIRGIPGSGNRMLEIPKWERREK